MNLPKFLRRAKLEPSQGISYQGNPITADLPDLASVLAPIPPKSKGRVIKQTRHSEFNPNPVKGGRVVKIMPRNLQKIKQAQEKFEDDSGPSVEDLSD